MYDYERKKMTPHRCKIALHHCKIAQFRCNLDALASLNSHILDKDSEEASSQV